MTTSQHLKILDSMYAADISSGAYNHGLVLVDNIVKLAELVNGIRESVEGSEKVLVPEDKDAMVNEVIKAMTEAGLTHELDIFRKNILE